VIALVDAEHAEEIRWNRVRCGASLPFPEGRAKIVALAEDGPLANIEGLRGAVKVKQATGQLEIRVSDCAVGIIRGHNAVRNELGPLKTPYDGGLGLPALTRDGLITEEPDSACARTGRVMVAFANGIKRD